jgi:hypothetical protein
VQLAYDFVMRGEGLEAEVRSIEIMYQRVIPLSVFTVTQCGRWSGMVE